jgi:uncharacterized membrane protein
MDALILTGLALVALWVAIVAGRRRAERRADEARARAQARRARVPVVSANLRGQRAGARDLWQQSVSAAERDASGPEAGAARPER